jgi:hypothetical protein
MAELETGSDTATLASEAQAPSEETNGTNGTNGTNAPADVQSAPPEEAPWHHILPGEYREKGYVKSRASLEEFLRHVDGLEQMQGKTILLPDNEADPQYEEKVKSVYKRLGALDDPQAYQFDVPEGAPINMAALDAFREASAEAGLSQRQADAIFKRQLESARQQTLKVEQTKAQMIAEMRDTWGSQVFAHKDGLAREMARRMGLHDELDNHGFFCLPHVVEAFADMAEIYQDGGMMPPGSPSGRSLGEVQDEIAQLKETKSAYWDPAHRDYQRTKERVAELQNLRAVLHSRR